MAFYDQNGKFVDDLRTVSLRYVSSVNSFWFDLVTSLPWSYLDLYAYQVTLPIRLEGHI